ncbi:M23 family metallopeptidase [Bizionia gelidisalsuginis]|uniref:M23 family metallopeptidase n=1 Tax=Bizionia gelidisalsuginis TaxID=291188 RepID=A0ABY3MDX8_9FLAO|nr:M23 family metallopeptidase [Bizionia gelidisalsuginis]TYC17150.1 M23 family metallopeptidase [Bizionia gelidisalsuginis]
MPVNGATTSDFNSKSYWCYPWRKSVTHKGVDILAKKGTKISAATSGLVLCSGTIRMGGNIVVILDPKWRLHYYAHLNDLKTSTLSMVTKKPTIGTIGTNGNAAGKSQHLHYAIAPIIPYIWRIDTDRQGWRKMFYLNPIDFLKGA